MTRARIAALFSAVLLFAAPSLSRAEDLSLEFRRRTYQQDRLYAEVAFAGDIAFDTLDAIRNGIMANFLVTAQLMKVGGMFEKSKEVVYTRTRNLTISYDVWEDRFVLTDRRGRRERQVGSLENMSQDLAAIVNPLDFRIPSPSEEDRYVLRAKIRIQTIKLFPPFGIFLYFFDPWNYETRWAYSDTFSYDSLKE